MRSTGGRSTIKDLKEEPAPLGDEGFFRQEYGERGALGSLRFPIGVALLREQGGVDPALDFLLNLGGGLREPLTSIWQAAV